MELALALLLAVASCQAVIAARAEARAAVARGGTPPSASTGSGTRAPTAPPLQTGDGEEASEESGASSEVAGDPLVGNGLGSPHCRDPFEGEALSPQASRNCATSGFVATPAPTADFGLDVHIDTGLLGLTGGTVDSLLQDVFVAPVWTGLVWVVHALCVMLEWCFTLDLLDSGATAGIGSGLREMQAAFTQPWLVSVLAAAGVVVLYNGLIRRRVAETLGEAALMAAMIVGGLWMIADPSGTVGALGRWANQASLGTLGVAARGTPRGAASSLGESMQTVFAAAIEAPWCYLEFGDVDWCRDTARLDPALRAAGLKIAAAELHGTPSQALERSARLLREAQTNGAIFLALPPNGPARNSINDEGSLLRTLCGSAEATNCRGATAYEAEFRTGGATMQRVAGLLFIVLGAGGMILLLAFVAVRLLGAALFSLLFLLLAPGMVLAPALGEGGRGVFRKWLAQLLGAVVSKLLFSFLLGVLLAVLTILSSLRAFGWWTQWLLMSAFWWGAFARRHHALALAEGSLRGARAGPTPPAPRPTLTRRLGGALETRKGWALAKWAHDKHQKAKAPELERHAAESSGPRAALGDAAKRAGTAARSWLDGQPGPHGPAPSESGMTGLEHAVPASVGQSPTTLDVTPPALDPDGGPAGARATGAPAARGQPDPAAGAMPRAAGTGEDRPARREPGHHTPAGDERAREQGVPPPEHMQHPDPVRRREARLSIDRELDRQREIAQAEAAARERRGERPPAARAAPDRPGPRQPSAPVSDAEADPAWESSVMRDAREVEAGRKRQLGHGRP